MVLQTLYEVHRPADYTTQAAEGMLRRRFTVQEVEAMTEAGILSGDERIELVGGEVVPMSPKGNHAVKLETRIHRQPSLTGYWTSADHGPDDELVPICGNELAVTLSALELY